MVEDFKKVHDVLVDAWGKFYDGKEVDFKQACENCKNILEGKELLGQNIGDYPKEYYKDFADIEDNKENENFTNG